MRQEETNQFRQNIATDENGGFTLLDGLPAYAGNLELRGIGPFEGLRTDGPVAVEVMAGDVLGLGDIVVVNKTAGNE